jgi:hypothetical protein
VAIWFSTAVLPSRRNLWASKLLRLANEIREITDLVDHQKPGAGIVTQAPAQGGQR